MSLRRPALLCIILCIALINNAFATDYFWIGNTGNWNSPSNWSLTSGGLPANSIPGIGDNVIIDHNSFDIPDQHIAINSSVSCDDFIWITNSNATLRGSGSLNVGGSLRSNTLFQSEIKSIVFSSNKNGEQINIGNSILKSDLVFDGSGEWDVYSNINLPNNKIILKKGELRVNGYSLDTEGLISQGSKQRELDISGSKVHVAKEWDFQNSNGFKLRSDVQSYLVIGDKAQTGDIKLGSVDYSGVNLFNKMIPCGTGPGETPFDVTPIVRTNYNGFNVSCKDSCDAELSVVVTGGVGPFSFTWVSGPNDSLWTTACAGNQIVIVTDNGQIPAVSCAATINVSDPALLSAFILSTTPPTCFGFCDGQIQTLAVGGAGGYIYSWTPSGSDSC